MKKGYYKILPDKKLIIEYYSGEIFMDDFIELKKKISQEKDYDPTFFSLLDFRDAAVTVGEQDMRRYLKFVKENSKVYGDRKTAYLTSTPDDVVVTTIFSTVVSETDVPINIKVCSTINAVIDWFHTVNIDEETIDLILDELKTQPGNVFEE